MNREKLNGADYLLLLLYIDNQSPILGAVRLTKMMFLFREEIADLLKEKGLDSSNLPEFFAYDFGPFSKDVYEQVEFFSGIGFISVTNVADYEEMGEVDDLGENLFIAEMFNQDEDYRYEGDKYLKYILTEIGIKYVDEEILGKGVVNEEHIELLLLFKKKITSLRPRQLLKYVYTKYPKYAENSLIRDKVL